MEKFSCSTFRKKVELVGWNWLKCHFPKDIWNSKLDEGVVISASVCLSNDWRNLGTFCMFSRSKWIELSFLAITLQKLHSRCVRKTSYGKRNLTQHRYFRDFESTQTNSMALAEKSYPTIKFEYFRVMTVPFSHIQFLDNKESENPCLQS